MSILKTNGILFDLDGTLWDSTSEIADAWNELIKIKGGVDRPPITKEELHGCMGLPMYSIAAKLFPDMPEKDRNNLMDEMGIFENDYLRERGAKLFDGIEKVINETSENVPIFIVSNCQSGYIEAFLHAHNFEDRITDKLCWGDTRLSKGENNKLIIDRNGITKPIYIGDTDGDSKSAAFVNAPFIFASYGFGHTDNYDAKVEKPEEILDIIEYL